MAKPEWGKKRTCQSCGTKYYDLNKIPMICPSCGTEFDPDFLLKNRKGRSPSPKSVVDSSDDLTEDMSDIEDIEIEVDDDVDDPLAEINKEDQNKIAEDEIDMNDSISFIEDNEISEDNSINVEINDDAKD